MTALRLLFAVVLSAIIPMPAAHADGLKAAFLGDSYVLGIGASDPGHGWAPLVAQREGWDIETFAAGGSGYDTDTPTDTNLGGRVPQLVASNPNVVVISGGLNDWHALNISPSSVFFAVRDTFNKVRAGLPNARIIGVGPTFTDGKITDDRIAFDKAVNDATTAVGGKFVSLFQPPVIQPGMVLPDHIHVNDAGHQAIANRVVSAT